MKNNHYYQVPFSLLLPLFVITFLSVSFSASAANINMVQNPSFETMGGNGDPDGWFHGGWGSYTEAIFTYPVLGKNSARAVKVENASLSPGDAEWYTQPIKVTGGMTYIYSDSYKSNVETKVFVRYLRYLGPSSDSAGFINQEFGPFASSSVWASATLESVAPDWAQYAEILHILPGAGSLEIDEVSFSLKEYPVPAPTGNTLAELQAQIANLLATIQDLQAKIASWHSSQIASRAVSSLPQI